jgi:hypothetical protein
LGLKTGLNGFVNDTTVKMQTGPSISLSFSPATIGYRQMSSNSLNVIEAMSQFECFSAHPRQIAESTADVLNHLCVSPRLRFALCPPLLAQSTSAIRI